MRLPLIVVAVAHLFAAPLFAAPLRAAPLDDGTQKELLALYDKYRGIMATGKFEAATSLMSTRLQKTVASETRTEKDKREAREMMRSMMPDSVTPVHGFIDARGTRARIVAQASKTVPRGVKLLPGASPPGTVMKAGITLGFVKENGWKIDSQTFSRDPAERIACTNEAPEPPSAYDENQQVNAGGPIARVEFKPDYTLIVFSVVGDANCAYLPSRAEIEKHGIRTEMLVPYAIVAIEGLQHKTDNQKILVDKLTVTAEE